MGTSTAARRLGKLLARLRAEAGLKPGDVETSRVTSRRSLRRFELGQIAPAWPTAVQLAILYGAPQEQQQAVKDLALRATDAEQLRERFHGEAPAKFSLLLDLEAEAAELASYDPEVVTPLLQTPEYAEAVLLESPLIDPADIDATLQARIGRRERVFAGSGRRRFLLTEGALFRRVGSAEIHAAQLDSLRADAARSGVEIRHLPNDAGAYGGAVGPYVYMEFKDADDLPIAYAENLGQSSYLDRPEITQRYRKAFNISWDKAVRLPA